MAVDDLLSARGVPVRVDAAGRGGRPRALPLPVRARLADRGAPAAARAARGGARHAARARRPAGTPLRIPARRRSPARSATSSATPPRRRSSRRGGRTRASSPTTAPPTRRRGSSCSRSRSAGSRRPARAAGDWLARALDRGGGLVRHSPGSWPALTQQGWRDTLDPTAAYGGGILRPDGTAPEPPLADLDSQAVAYAALRALAGAGATHPHDSWAARADALRERLSELVPDVMAVEAGGPRRCRGPGRSSAGCCGRTRSSRRRATPPPSGCAGPTSSPGTACAPCRASRRCSSRTPTTAARCGRSTRGSAGAACAPRAAAEEAERVRAGVLAALDRLGRAPELYAVNEVGEVEPIALSNRVQAWTVGARWALENEWDGRPAPAVPL